MASTLKPPSSTTGAPNNTPTENRCIIDWFAFTLPFKNVSEVFNLLNLKEETFTSNGRGGMGYKNAHRFQQITVFSDGADNMGCHVEMSGQGCRQYETDGLEWRELITRIFAVKGHFTRLDIALDVVDGTLPLEKIEEYYSTNRFRSFFRRSQLIKNDLLTADGPLSSGFTRYFGSKTSRTLFRIYDKAAQMGLPDAVSWIRFEIQLRDERAEFASELILKRDDLGKIAVAVINHNLSFIELDVPSNKSLCTLAIWWSSWLQTTEKLKLTKKKLIRLLDQCREHLIKQYAPTIAMLKEGLGFTGFKDFMRDIIAEGNKRMTMKHYDIIYNSQVYCDVPF